MSPPTFLIGILLIWSSRRASGLVPESFGRGERTNQLGWWSSGVAAARGWHHRAAVRRVGHLPAHADHYDWCGPRCSVLRATTSSSRARGLSNRAIHFGPCLKNTLVPVMTITGLQQRSDRLRHHHQTVFQWRAWASCSLSCLSPTSRW